MGVPLRSSANRVTASSSVTADYSRTTLHSFNPAAVQALLLENCGAPRADGSQGFNGTAAVGVDVSVTVETVLLQPENT